jgi:hypothetical protein
LSSVPDVLFGLNYEGVLAPRRQQYDAEHFCTGLWLGVVHRFILKEESVPARPQRFRAGQERSEIYEPM